MKTLLTALYLSFAFCISYGQASSVSETTTSIVLEKQKACDVISMDQIAELLDVESSKLVEEDMSFAESKRRSICHVIAKDVIASCNIRLGWKSKKAEAKKRLEQSYTRYLTSGEENVNSYEEISNTNDTQILFGKGSSKSGNLYVVRKRFGNSSEVKIEVLKESEDDSLKSRLVSIVENIK